jgi:predicted GIY-YIG superfamily endonuclease
MPRGRYFVYILTSKSRKLYVGVREKQIKGWVRKKKIALIESGNPTWEDLSEAWYKADSSLRSE